MSEGERIERHESYGLVSFSRRTGNPGKLFGSSLRDHASSIMLSVRRGEVIHNLGYDRYTGSIRGDLIEVELSAAQFAELLTTMNVGVGVPCTVRYVDGKRMENPPETSSETEKIQEGFRADIRKLVANTKAHFEKVKELLNKKSFTKADKAELIGYFHEVLREVGANAPFMLDQFEEATERITTHAKAEVDALVTHNIMAEGLRVFRERARVKELPANTDE